MSPRGNLPPGPATGHNYPGIDYRAHPEQYRIGRGEQGVLTVEPYKSELLPHWRFRTPEIAQVSAAALWERFLAYMADDDFVGMDMARKFLQMGYTRARRYANHPGGRKYDPETGAELPQQLDALKAESARVFYPVWRQAAEHPTYLAARTRHKQQHEGAPATPGRTVGKKPAGARPRKAAP